MMGEEAGTRKNLKLGESVAVSALCVIHEEQEDICVDWRGRPCKPNRHGGMSAALFVLGLSLSHSILAHSNNSLC